MIDKDKIELLGRAGLKYIDEFGVEYFIDTEIVVNENHHFVLWSDSIELFENYLKEKQSGNIIFTKTYDKIKKCSIGKIEYKTKYYSNIPDDKKRQILNRIIELSN
ncbi:MAG: hypothetical protein LBT62_06880, partial [Deltaproteobacteria bacterium]|nr:hypothetical protein [Deltaproteobacteria bacterium]